MPVGSLDGLLHFAGPDADGSRFGVPRIHPAANQLRRIGIEHFGIVHYRPPLQSLQVSYAIK